MNAKNPPYSTISPESDPTVTPPTVEVDAGRGTGNSDVQIGNTGYQSPPPASSAPPPPPSRRRRRYWILAVLVAVLVAATVWLGLYMARQDRLITERLAGLHTQTPAKVFARPLELFPGRYLTPAQVVSELSLLGYRSSTEYAAGNFDLNGNTLQIQTRGFHFPDGQEFGATAEVGFADGRVEYLLTDGQSAPLLRLEPLLLGAIHPVQHEDRMVVTSNELPEGFLDTLIAVEDRRFYSHPGISLRGIARAAWVNFRTGSRRQGASTLTQQLVKNVFLTSEKSMQRKAREAAMAVLVERRYSKTEIAQMFINEVFLAQDGNRAIHGFGLAAWHFYDKPLKELTLPEYALLIGMIKAPSSYNPERNPARPQQRRNVVLQLLQRQGKLSEDEFQQLRELPLNLFSGGERIHRNPAFLDLVKRQLIEEYSLQDLQAGGLHIFTHYDPLIQEALEASVSKVLQQRDPAARTAAAEDSATRLDVTNPANAETGSDASAPRLAPQQRRLQAAAVVTDPDTGAITALLGSRDGRRGGFNRALDAKRPVGSLLKPAVFLNAWQQAPTYTLGTRISDAPFILDLPNGDTWQPSNYNDKQFGSIMMIDALSKSLNLATARLGLQLGLDNVIETLHQLGIERDLPELPSLLLGAVDLTPFEMLQMYQTIAARGYRTPTRAINEVTNARDETLSQYGLEVQQVIDPAPMHLLRFAMADTMERGTGRSAKQALASDMIVAGKTGTSDNLRDSWFAGFSGDALAVIWVGYDDNAATGLTGSSGALQIWTQLMAAISHEPMDLSNSEGIVVVAVDPDTGKRTRDNCKSATRLPHLAAGLPKIGISCRGRATGVRQWFQDLLD